MTPFLSISESEKHLFFIQITMMSVLNIVSIFFNDISTSIVFLDLEYTLRLPVSMLASLRLKINFEFTISISELFSIEIIGN